jgi:hypothetical protein
MAALYTAAGLSALGVGTTAASAGAATLEAAAICESYHEPASGMAAA